MMKIRSFSLSLAAGIANDEPTNLCALPILNASPASAATCFWELSSMPELRPNFFRILLPHWA